jgi:hypothetical protein
MKKLELKLRTSAEFGLRVWIGLLSNCKRASAQWAAASRYSDPDGQLTYPSQELLVWALITSETVQ